MKILHICLNALYTEGYTYQDNLLPIYHKKLGHEVMILTNTKARNIKGNIIKLNESETISPNGVIVKRINCNNKFFNALGIHPKVSKILYKFKPDFIFLHGLCSFIPIQIIKYKKKNKITVVADNHLDEGITEVNKFPTKQILFIYKFFWKFWINHFNKIYAVTSWRKEFAKKYYNIPDDKLDILLMGIDSDKLPKDFINTRKTVRKKYNITDKTFLLIHGGKLDYNKKTIEILKAFSEIKNDNVNLLIFGSVINEIKKEFDFYLNNDKRIKYIGYKDSAEIHKLFIASDFGLFPGNHSVLWEEAIGCSLPCLFKKYSENDHTNVCDNCISINNNIESINKILNKILLDKEYYNYLKANSIKAAPYFSYKKIAEKSLECII